MLIEVSCGSVEQAVLASSHGADRIEICSALSAGGITPSVATFSILKSQLSIPVFVMIAQPEANFNPSEPDFQAMLQDVKIFADAGADGFVFGCITPQSKLDISRNSALLAVANSLPCTFHRAFDSIDDPIATAQILAELGFTRILTSGHAPSVTEGLDTLSQLIKKSPIQILPGGGVRPENAAALQKIGATEVHFSITSSGSSSGYLGYPLPILCPERIKQVRESL